MKAAYSVTGPGVERSAGSSALGLSAATTFANRATIARVEASFYVRDPDGTVVGRADSDGIGGVRIYGQDSLTREKSLTSGPSDGRRLSAAPPVGRPEGRPRRPRNPSTANPPATGDNVATGSVELGGATTTTERKRSMATQKDKEKKTASNAAAAESVTTGEDLVAALMGALETQIGQPVEKRANPSGTYSRLLIAGKAFAYLFPPRPSGVLLKIPKQLIGVEKDLPKGHGFKRVGWGLTRTISKKNEVETAASALAVAANATTPKEQVAA